MKTIYIVEWRLKKRRKWAIDSGQIAPGGFLSSYEIAECRVELFGAHDNCEYRIIPYTRGEL